MEDEDFLTPEELEASTKKVIPFYYAYYNDDGELTDVSNSLLENKDKFLQISHEVFEQFITGKEQFSNWVVNRTKNATNEFGIELVSKINQSLTFKNNMFERINKPPTDDTEVTVHWDQYHRTWIFVMSDAARQRVYDNEIGTKTLSFFITYASSFDLLIRTIDIQVSSLIYDKVEIPFESDKELKINNINVSTKHAFDNYALVVWKEYEQKN